MTSEDSTDARTLALALLRAGEGTESQIARFVGVDRQLVHYWAKTNGIDVKAACNRRLVKAARNIKQKRG